jgi:hypothetical protein
MQGGFKMKFLLNKRRFFAAMLAAVFLFSSSGIYAAWPAIPSLARLSIWFGKHVAANQTAYEIGEAVLAAVGIGASIDYFLLSDKQFDDPSASSFGKSAVVVHLNPSAKRANPDPVNWNDAGPGQVDPSPKPAVVSLDGGYAGNVSGGKTGVGKYVYENGSFVLKPAIDESSITSRLIKGSGGAKYCSEWDPVVTGGGYVTCLHEEDYYYVDAKLGGISINTTSPVNIGGVDISYDKFNSARNSKSEVVFIDSKKALRYTWKITPFYFKGSSFSVSSRAIVSGSQTLNNGNSVKTYHAADLSSTVSDARAYAAESSLSNEVRLGPFANTESSVTDVVRFEHIPSSTNPYYSVAHVVTVQSLCGAGQSYNAVTESCVMDGEVEKPATLACEVVWLNGKWDVDKRNPNCEKFGSKFSVFDAAARLKGDDGEVEVYRNPDGTYVITVNDSNGTWHTLTTDNSSGSGHVINSIVESDTGAFRVPVVYPGNNGGSGNNGDGGGACGGEGQKPCSIDDSGFDGAADEVIKKYLNWIH